MNCARLNEKIVIKSVAYNNVSGDLIPTESILCEPQATVTHKTTTTEDGIVYDVVNFYFRYYPNLNYSNIIYYLGEKHKIVAINKPEKAAISIDAIRVAQHLSVDEL